MSRAPRSRVLRCTAATALAAGAAVAAPAVPAAAATRVPALIPAPAHETAGTGTFALTPASRIVINSAARPVARQLRAGLQPSTGYDLPIVSGTHPGAADISLAIDSSAVPADQAAEGYLIDVTGDGVALKAATPHGLFDGVQTLRQLLPTRIAATTRQPGPWRVPAVHIADSPRFAYRGFMLDIARHYEPPSAVMKLLDEVSKYKINTFHLHLSDDQGFRVAIKGFPRLTRIGGQGSLGTQGRPMDPGGFWTQQQYREVVRYAAQRFMTVVPEVDSPGHNDAIVMSEYNDLNNPRLNGSPQDINCTVNHPPRWNYTEAVGMSAMCAESSNTWAILRAIIQQLSAMSPGPPYYDLGGDEVPTSVLSQDRYAALVNKESRIVARQYKTVMGWADISTPGTHPPAGSVAEYWNPASGSDPGTETATDAVKKDMKLVMAPANHAYLDQKYAPDTPKKLGLTWACPNGCDVDQFYNWDPITYVSGINSSDVLGVEGALWSETLRTERADEYMVFPRLQALAEIGWSPRVERTADSAAYADFLHRLAVDGERMKAAGITFYRTPEVSWRGQ